MEMIEVFHSGFSSIHATTVVGFNSMNVVVIVVVAVGIMVINAVVAVVDHSVVVTFALPPLKLSLLPLLLSLLLSILLLCHRSSYRCHCRCCRQCCCRQCCCRPRCCCCCCCRSFPTDSSHLFGFSVGFRLPSDLHVNIRQNVIRGRCYKTRQVR